ncbi:GTP-binding protein EngB [Cupriavidus pampae]|uniref:Probable GTP-binding protein EngB n=1 Tax=Cupriavidus pampae TaxID=659251 RepID=A0ABM8Y1H5_9BURK|nr:ribosome biogenesis GTP-binding protein YihA/YsxC [Cupriavidus pampae]CAG9186585.1 GTP-binding protein EngB [Cupriavidus pampae]
MSLLHQARFFITVNHLRDLPATAVPEVAFAGRSNAGKSTAINILCNQKRLAFSSRTPGRTQHINFFSVAPVKAPDPLAFLVDLPGYGYAEVSGTAKYHWQGLLSDYVQTRTQLSGLVLMMDARRPFTDLDCQMVEWFLPTGRPIHVLLTKADKLTNSENALALRQTRKVLAGYADQLETPVPMTAQLFSSIKRRGIEEAQRVIAGWLSLPEALAPEANGVEATESSDESSDEGSAADEVAEVAEGADAAVLGAGGAVAAPVAKTRKVAAAKAPVKKTKHRVPKALRPKVTQRSKSKS